MHPSLDSRGDGRGDGRGVGRGVGRGESSREMTVRGYGAIKGQWEADMGALGSPLVVGYIDTPEGAAAVDRAIVEAKHRGAPLVIVNSQRGGASLDRDAAQALESDVERVAARARAEGIEVRVRQLVRDSDPATDLISVAIEEDADLIVIGLRRRSPVGKLILGSNAQSVLLDAPCPVLAVKVP